MISKIQNLDVILPNHAGYGVILSEHHPDVVFEKNAIGFHVDSYLWYPIILEKLPHSFTDFFCEKLGITDPMESERLIES